MAHTCCVNTNDTGRMMSEIVKKAQLKPSLFPYTEEELIAELTPEIAHAEELAEPSPEEYEV